MTGLLNLTSGTLAITSGNLTIDGPGPGVIEVDGDRVQILSVSAASRVAISGLRFAGGGATANGGAIANSGTLDVSDAVFDHNSAVGAGSSTLSQGGAIYNAGSLNVTDSTFTDNTAGGAGGGDTASGAGEGGAIFSSGSLTVTGSTFAGNVAGGDGGAGTDSGEGVGGAIDNDQNGGLTLTNSTLTANTVGGAEGGGSLSGEGFGGGVSIANGATATLQHDTIDANSVASVGIGAGIDNVGAVTADGTIVSGNTGAGNCADRMLSRDSLEGPTVQTSCGFDLPSADPLLGPLADNGGPTETQALGAGSPAIGAVVPASDCPVFDQRGAARSSAALRCRRLRGSAAVISPPRR